MEEPYAVADCQNLLNIMRILRQMLDLELTLRINMAPYDIFTEGVFNYV